MKRYFATHTVVNARPLTDEDRKANNIEDDRKEHIGIWHPVTGQLMNTMAPDQFQQHYLDVSDTAEIQPGTPQAPASNDPNDKKA